VSSGLLCFIQANPAAAAAAAAAPAVIFCLHFLLAVICAGLPSTRFMQKIASEIELGTQAVWLWLISFHKRRHKRHQVDATTPRRTHLQSTSEMP